MLGRLSRWASRLVLRATGRAADLRLDGDAKLVLAPRIQGHRPVAGGENANVISLQTILAERARLKANASGVRRFDRSQANF